MTTKAWEEPRPGEEPREPNKELETLDLQVAMEEKRQRLDLLKKRMTVEELDDLQSTLIAKQSELNSIEVAQKRKAEEHERIETNLVIKANSIATERQNWDVIKAREMEEAREVVGRLGNYLETLAVIIFNQPVPTADGEGYRDQTPAKREELIKYLEPVMKAAGITIALDDVGEYVTQLHRSEKQRREAY